MLDLMIFIKTETKSIPVIKGWTKSKKTNFAYQKKRVTIKITNRWKRYK